MTFSDLWAAYTAKNPHWLTEGAAFTPDGLRRLVEQTFEQGRKQGFRAGASVSQSRRQDSEMPDFLKDLLGGMKGRSTP